ncbi:MAG: hypothetical protein K0R29_924 [Pseudobdellovibrio sp.]|jgi:hypothetical protein|nr:hypothetical protein [Pseudobdellovibrio sp.]
MKKKSVTVDTRRPRMFSEEKSFAEIEKTVSSIAELKNLGPATEKHFHKAGIKTVAQFKNLGWKKTLAQLVKSNPKHRHSLFAYALIGALKNQEWFRISEEEKLEAREFTATLKPAKKSLQKPKGKK